MASFTDQLQTIFTKVINDIGNFADQLIFNVSKFLDDSFFVSEQISKILTRPLSDAASFTDQIFINRGRLFNNISTATDSGVLLAQGYCDNMDYFDDDYVGAKRIF